MDWRDPATASYTAAVTTMLSAAVDFGLTPEEARHTLHQAMADPRREASVADYLDRIAGALSREILAKQRRMLGSF
jgi:phage terminase small subunit